MRAATKFLAEARDRDDADLVTVLLAEERHCPRSDRFLRVLHLGLHRGVLQHLLVDDALDFELLLAGDGTEMHEVEAQSIWCHE